MLTKWFYDCKTSDEKKKRESVVRGNKESLDILCKVCYNILQDKENSSLNDYSNPNWALKQADIIGYRRAITDLIKMCNLDNESIDQNAK